MAEYKTPPEKPVADVGTATKEPYRVLLVSETWHVPVAPPAHEFGRNTLCLLLVTVTPLESVIVPVSGVMIARPAVVLAVAVAETELLVSVTSGLIILKRCSGVDVVTAVADADVATSGIWQFQHFEPSLVAPCLV